jgi:hypothetical protein
VTLGYVPPQGRIPTPDMSFARIFAEHRSKWELRGQYAIWTGAREPGEARYRLLERVGRKVARVERPNGGAVMHRVPAGTEFMVENLAGYWLSLDVDSIWIETPSSGGQYCMLIIGGSTGKPDAANVGWVCPKCGSSLAFKAFQKPLRDFTTFLSGADKWVDEFNTKSEMRTCQECKTVHPQSQKLAHDNAGESK